MTLTISEATEAFTLHSKNKYVEQDQSELFSQHYSFRSKIKWNEFVWNEPLLHPT